jgi:hypothetical protein
MFGWLLQERCPSCTEKDELKRIMLPVIGLMTFVLPHSTEFVVLRDID